MMGVLPYFLPLDCLIMQCNCTLCVCLIQPLMISSTLSEGLVLCAERRQEEWGEVLGRLLRKIAACERAQNHLQHHQQTMCCSCDGQVAGTERLGINGTRPQRQADCIEKVSFRQK